jgi:hypothetical protein
MPRTQQLQGLLIGQTDHGEFLSAAQWLAEQLQLTCRKTALAAVAEAQSLPSFDLIVLAQMRPGQFSVDEVESLHRSWPLGKLVALLGSWCDGEGRTGRPWPGVWRVPAGDFTVQVGRLLAGDRQRSRAWLLPRTISDAERFYYDAAEAVTHASGTARIAAATHQAFESLADAVHLAGLVPVWHPTRRTGDPLRGCSPASGVGNALPRSEVDGLLRPDSLQPSLAATSHDPTRTSVGIWDAANGDDAEWDGIRRFAHEMQPAGVVVLLGFPRWADRQRAAAISLAISGAPDHMVVIGKPLRLTDLCDGLVRKIGITVTRDRSDSSDVGRKDTPVLTSGREYY